MFCLLYIFYYEYRRRTVIVETIKWKKVGRAIKKTTSSATKAVSSGVQQGASVVGSGVQQGASVVGSGVQQGASVVGSGLQQGASVVGSGVQQGASVVGSGIQTGISEAGSLVQDALDSLKWLEIGKLVNQIKGAFKDSLSSVEQLGVDFGNNVSSYVDKLQNIA